MKKNVLMLLSVIAFFSCDSDIDSVVGTSLDSRMSIVASPEQAWVKDEQIMSEENHETVLYDTVFTKNTSRSIQFNNALSVNPFAGSVRRSVQRYDGKASGTPKKVLSRQEVVIANVTGVPNGVYLADVWETSGSIDMPKEAKNILFALPDVCGYVDWRAREEGVKVTFKQVKKKWSFC